MDEQALSPSFLLMGHYISIVIFHSLYVIYLLSDTIYKYKKQKTVW